MKKLIGKIIFRVRESLQFLSKIINNATKVLPRINLNKISNPEKKVTSEDYNIKTLGQSR